MQDLESSYCAAHPKCVPWACNTRDPHRNEREGGASKRKLGLKSLKIAVFSSLHKLADIMYTAGWLFSVMTYLVCLNENTCDQQAPTPFLFGRPLWKARLISACNENENTAKLVNTYRTCTGSCRPLSFKRYQILVHIESLAKS